MASMSGRTREVGVAAAFVRWHYPVGTAILLALSLVAFGDNLFTDIGQPSNSDPKMVVHGLFALGWMVLLVVQANLPRMGKLHLHKRLGIAAFIVGTGVVLSTGYLFVAVWRGWAQMSDLVAANRILLPSFGLFVLGAWFQRQRPDWHKRLIYCGTLFLMEPIFSRAYDPLVAPFMPVYPPGEDDHLFYSAVAIAWSLLFAGQLLYDWLKSARFHPVSLFAFAWTALVYSTLFAF